VRETYFKPQALSELVRGKIGQVRERGETIDYLAFVPDGEPTLDINLGREIELIKSTGIRIAVITNASLIWRDDVRQDLLKADWVCLKFDAVSAAVWRKINRPDRHLAMDNILEGLRDFARSFPGELATETMLVRGLNDSAVEIGRIASFLGELKPAVSYLAVPTRPPAEPLEPVSAQAINCAYQIMSRRLRRVEYLIGYEGDAFASTGDIRHDLLSITAVHPMREDAVAKMLDRLGGNRDAVREMVSEGSLLELHYRGKKFYARKLPDHIPA
jgi:wyosine [tRNA(Phe)-imidazoG37] synthetase (radical SAM superfamily)